jgi:O-antigen/teichoic acid export membrane protein
MSRAHSILKNTAANYIQQFVAVAVFMFLTPYAAKQLGTEQFGLWSLMWSMVGLLALVDMGVSSAVVKFISDARGRQSEDRIQQLYSTFFWVQAGLAGLVMLLGFAIAPFLGRIFEIPNTLLRMAAVVFIFLSFRVATGMPFGLFAGLLTSHRKQAFVSLSKAGGVIVYGLFAFLVLRFKPTAASLAVCNVAVHILSNLVIVVVAVRQVSGFTIRPSLFSRSLVREISSFSGAAFLVQISSLLYTRVDLFVIQRVMSLANVARYSVAMQTIERGSSFCHQMTRALTPLIAEMKGAKDDQAVRLILRKGTKLNAALATPLLGGLIWLAPDLIRSWMGVEFSSSILPMQMLAGVAWMTAFTGISFTAFTMTGHEKTAARLTIAGQLLNLVLTLLLVRPYGLNGVAFASLVSGVVTAAVAVLFTVRAFKISFLPVFGPALYSALLPLLPMFAVIAGLQWGFRALGFDEPHLLIVAVEEGIGCVVFFVAFYLIGCSAKEKGYYREKVLSAVASFRGRG